MARRIQVWTLGEPVPAALAARGRFFEMFRAAIAAGQAGSPFSPPFELSNVEGVRGSELPSVGSQDAVILTGSPAYVRDREPWVLRAESRVRDLVAAGIPVLGICFGHQILGEALGGYVDRNPNGREIGTARVRMLAPDDLVFRPSLDRPTEVVQMSHLDSVLQLPRGAEVLARTELEPFAAVRFGPRAWGLQFHPEMDDEIARHYILAREEAIREEGLDFQELLEKVEPGSYGPRILARFIELLHEGP
jgi:GMP synthase (glutamine-hydrolysing)